MKASVGFLQEGRACEWCKYFRTELVLALLINVFPAFQTRAHSFDGPSNRPKRN